VPTRISLWFTCVVCIAGCGASSEKTTEHANPASGSSTSAAATEEPNQAAIEQSLLAEQTDGKLALDRLVFAVPEGWQRKPASSGFVLAEFALPKAEGDEADGRLTVSVAGGSIEANIDRWREQFGNNPERAEEGRKEIGGLSVTIVDFSGEFNDQRGPFAPATRRSGYRMLAAIIPVDGELHFVKVALRRSRERRPWPPAGRMAAGGTAPDLAVVAVRLARTANTDPATSAASRATASQRA
jgi:hypothetical protein